MLTGPHDTNGTALLAEALQPWKQVTSKADAFFDQTRARHAPRMACKPGCTLCCQQDLSVLLVEALAVAVHLRGLAESTQRRLAERTVMPAPPCALLDGDRCAVYPSRPLICRTHGLPVTQSPANGSVASGASVDLCSLNFTEGVPDDAVLHGGRLVAGLTVADALARRRLGELPPQRFALRDIAASCGQTVLEKVGLDCCSDR